MRKKNKLSWLSKNELLLKRPRKSVSPLNWPSRSGLDWRKKKPKESVKKRKRKESVRKRKKPAFVRKKKKLSVFV